MVKNLYTNSAIVTDGNWRKSLSVVRSLGKRGCNIGVIGYEFFTTAFWSRYAKNHYILKDPNKFYSRFSSELIAILKKRVDLPKPVLFPMEDLTIRWAVDNIKNIEKHCYLLVPDSESLSIAQDKYETFRLATELGVPCPETFLARKLSKLEELITNAIDDSTLDSFILKPVSGSGSSGVVYGKDILDIDLKSYFDVNSPVLFQRLIPENGEAICVSILMDRQSNVVAHFSHKRIHQFPVSGGPSTDRIGIRNEELVNRSVKLLSKINWVGVAMVEWKYDKPSRQVMLLEINPRFWGSLELAVRSGIDFPYLYFVAAQDIQPPQTKDDYSIDIRCRWLIPGDILSFLTDKSNRRRNIKSFIRGLPSEAEEWDKADLLGFFSVLLCSFVNLFKSKYWKYLRSKRY